MTARLLRGHASVLLLILAAGCNRPATSGGATASPATTPAAAAAVSTDDQKTLYAMGFIAGQNFTQFKFSADEMASIKKGIDAAASGQKPEFDLLQIQPRIQPFLEAKAAAARVANVGVAQQRKQADADMAVKAASEPGAQRLDQGVVLLTLRPGTGASPKATSTVSVHYEGKLKDGTVFDSSVQRGQPVQFVLNQVIPCWTMSLQRMKVGEKARLTCPSDAAYGDQGSAPVIPPGATLVFEVELLGVK